jgi:CRP-like cAMP-binding protein
VWCLLQEWSRSIKGSFFDQLTSNAMRKEVCRRLLGATFSQGQMICEQGEIGDLFYIIVTGSVSVLVNGNEVAALNAGAAFGELSLTGETEDDRK